MAIYFSNPGHIELDTIRTMGVSVKEGENPIGYFGTGLKYAIATLLRTGHIVSLRTNGETIQFRTKPKEIRGKMFNMIYMDDEQLGFTTDLGRDWQVWQAYRELYSNCMDEGGTVGGFPQEMDTVFTVEGPEIADVHGERSKIFLHSEPWLIADGIEIHRGASEYVYYRGVRVQTLVKKTRFTYNFTVPMRLTEDRTFASVFDMNYKLATRLPRVANPDFCNKIIDPMADIYEASLDFGDCADASEEFLDALEKYKDHANLGDARRNMLRKRRGEKANHTVYTLSESEREMVLSACKMLEKLNIYVRMEDMSFVEHLGPNVYAEADGSIMRLTRQCLANGRDFVAITIYEEWLHNNMGFADCSRGMQQFLFDKILELIKR